MINTIVQKSADFLQAVLTRQKDLFDYMLYFENLDKLDLVELLNEEKKIVWINLYNAFTQVEMKSNTQGKIYASMFTEELFTVAEEPTSLDMIEHGILRGNKWKYGLGFIHGFQLPSRIRHWKCKNPDPRIHFLLNCGAKSCPVIRVLTPLNITKELEEAEKDYILQEVDVIAHERKMLVPGLFLYYLGDFGGKRNVRKRIEKYIPKNKCRLSFTKFDWHPEPMKIKR
jgi:hypothetical protein